MSANGFFVSEQKPLLGRAFVPEDERPGAPAVVELTYHVWQDRFGKDPQILGKSIRINDVPTTVIGVMPAGKRFPEETDLWMPLVADAHMESSQDRSLTLFGRLRDGIRMPAARTELSNLADALADQDPTTNKGMVANVQTIAQITGAYDSRPIFLALWLAVGFVLLIACADVANMLLARGAGRVREISIRSRPCPHRTATTYRKCASRDCWGISWLAGCAGISGLVDAATSSQKKPLWLNLSLDKTAFAYMALISIATGILFGLAPALRLARIDVHNAIKDGGLGIGRGRRIASVSNLLVIGEMMLCIVLLTGAGLMIRSTVNLYAAHGRKDHECRSFTESDGITGPPVALVNESFAQAYWPDEDVIGKRIRLVKQQLPQAWLTVIGVVPDILQNPQRPLEHDPLIYLPYAQEPQRQVFIVVKTRVAFGLPAAWAIAHVLQRILIGVSAADPITLLGVILTLIGVGIAGCAIPARRAVRVDPIVALRYE